MQHASVRDDSAHRPPRKASRATRRMQMIEATISVLAQRGYAATTLTEVAVRAGVSHGMVNFHFQSKQNLLVATLEYLAAEYRQNWNAALEAAGPDPARQLIALIRADFAPAIVTPDRLSAWCSFWGEAQNKPMYQELCGANDAAYHASLERICAAIIVQGGYPHSAEAVARAIRCLTEGLWLEMMTAPSAASVAGAMESALAVAEAFFPRHCG